MNARVKELMPKPWVFPYPDREMYSKEQMEHFAELIIRECTDIAYEYDEPKLSGPGMIIAGRIEQQFGIEE